MVGEIGFEPTTHWSQTSCATKLRYAESGMDITAGKAKTSRAETGIFVFHPIILFRRFISQISVFIRLLVNGMFLFAIGMLKTDKK